MHLAAIGQPVFDLYYVSDSTLRTVHAPPLSCRALSIPEIRIFIG